LHRLNGIEIKESDDTALSAKKIKDSKLKDTAAIGNEMSAKRFGLQILEKRIETHKKNFTRFLILKKTTVPPSDANKTSIVFSVRNLPGALFRSLSVFALRDIDLYKIESRPLHGKPWEYFFYIDFAGSVKDRNCRNAMTHLGETASFLKLLGSYRRDVSKK